MTMFWGLGRIPYQKTGEKSNVFVINNIHDNVFFTLIMPVPKVVHSV